MIIRIFAGAVALCLSASAMSASLVEDARAFGSRENLLNVAISPSGKKIALLVSGPGSTTLLRVLDTSTGALTDVTKSDKPQSLRWCNFAGDDQIVCKHSGIEPFDGLMTGFSGLISVASDGSSMKTLKQRTRYASDRIIQSLGDVIDWLPDQDGNVLMAREYGGDVATTGNLLSHGHGGLVVERIDVKSLKSARIEPPNESAVDYMTDGRGHVRIMINNPTDSRGVSVGSMRINYRTATSKEWKSLGTYGTDKGGMLPLAVDADSNSLFALRSANGRDALYSIKLDGSGAATVVASQPNVDVDDVVRLGSGQRVIGYTFADDRRHTVYFDPEFMRLQAALAKSLPGRPQISFLGSTADGNQILVLAEGDTHPGTVYRFDKTTKQLAEVASVRTPLDGRQLATVKPITVTAADGAKIPAYLTLPPAGAGRNMPAIVLPHGGPSARDEWGFDWLSQFLAARGYAVIQPNYRGSAGYGEAWMAQNGFRGWRTSIADITASANYLVKEGIADPNRLAILGWSYGGYAALQSAAKEPKLYRAAIAIAPLTDMTAWREEFRRFTNYDAMRDYLGEGPHLVEGSPAQNASTIAVPVLLFHGDRDANVSISQSERMDAALRKLGKPVQFTRYKDLDHQLDDSEARIDMLTKIGEFLDRQLAK